MFLQVPWCPRGKDRLAMRAYSRGLNTKQNSFQPFQFPQVVGKDGSQVYLEKVSYV